MIAANEIESKLSCIRSLLEKSNRQSMLISDQPTFSWLTAGARGFLGLASTKACASLLVSRKKVYLLANNIEGRRLMEEEGLGNFCELFEVPWQQDKEIIDMAREKLGEVPVTESEFGDELAKARRVLCRQEQDRFSSLCASAAQALEEALAGLSPGISEFEAAGQISAALWSRSIEPISLFVAADSRSLLYRHFIPTEKRAYSCLIASICGRKGGLVASATRTVFFSGDFRPLEQRFQALLSVEEAAWRALTPGRPLSQVYQILCDTYESNDLAGEWRLHHQGGMTGYLPREVRIDGACAELVQAGQAYAFNPSCRGAKTEDTVLLTTEGVRVLTVPSEKWPSVARGDWMRPGILKRNI